QMVGFAPTLEGAAEAMPGTIRIAAAKGPCRLQRFEYNVTQGHVLEISHLAIRIFTNDAQVMEGMVPYEVVTPYSYAQVQELAFEQSYDVLYLYHPSYQTREFVRTAGDEFEINLLELENGPFEPRNTDKSITVSASAVTGAVTLTASSGIFAATDEGSLFQMEADDFGDITAWEPYITVTNGQLLTWNEKVYRVVGGSGRTGALAPVHFEGVEWDGIGVGADINDQPAGGCQLEYVHDRFGILRITNYVSATEVEATVLRTLPFTASTSYEYTGGYYDGWGDWVPPVEGVTYGYGTWRWRFGSFSDTRGWPQCGVIWNERHVLFKGSTGYASVAGDLKNHATYNELGDITSDMAFIFTIKDPNAVLRAVADDKLLMFTASGVWALNPSNAAQGIGPGNYRVDRQSNGGGAAAMPAEIESRVVYIDRSKRRIFEADYEAQRNVESVIDLTRYARHIGGSRFIQLATQQQPMNMIFAVRGNGTLSGAAYLPEEQVLGWCQRPMGSGIAARSICSITDPNGEFEQLWIAAEYGGSWHILLMDEWRRDDESRPNAVMVDLAKKWNGAPATDFTIGHLPNAAIHVVADGRLYTTLQTDGAGNFSLPIEASIVVAGLPYSAHIKQLRTEKGGDNGPAIGKSARISRGTALVLNSRGLQISANGNRPPRALELLVGNSYTDTAFDPFSGFMIAEDLGDYDRGAWLKIERVAPAECTILGLGQICDAAEK
uniref:hypothetical protein n=1 Tax=uncultured Sphingorhabdus sp. TaxID=1686106 RepID=UPI002638208F